MAGNNITIDVIINGQTIAVQIPPIVGIELTPNPIPYVQQTSDWSSVVDPTRILNKPNLTKQNTVIKSSDYTMTLTDQVVVFTSSANYTLLPATATTHSVRVIARNCVVTFIPNGTDVIKGEARQQISGYSDLILTDTQTGFWE